MQLHPCLASLAARLRGPALALLALLALPSCEDGAEQEEILCLDWDPGLGACLSREEAYQEMSQAGTCETRVLSVDSDAEVVDGDCCYEATIQKNDDECRSWAESL